MHEHASRAGPSRGGVEVGVGDGIWVWFGDGVWV